MPKNKLRTLIFAQNAQTMDKFEKIKQEAIAHGLCEQWQSEWGEPNLEQLCRFFHRGQDFCIKEDFPSLDTLKEYQGQIEQYGIYTDRGTAKNQPFVVALGDADINVEVNNVTDLTVRHNATVHLYLYGKCLCYVSAWNNCKIVVEHKDSDSRLCMSYWSGEIVGKEYFDKIHNK